MELDGGHSGWEGWSDDDEQTNCFFACGDDDFEDEERNCQVCDLTQAVFALLGFSSKKKVSNSAKGQRHRVHSNKGDKEDPYAILKSGQVKAKVNKSSDFYSLKVKNNRLYMENESSYLGYIRAYDVIELFRHDNSLGSVDLFFRESNAKMHFEFENLLHMDLFCKWLKKRVSTPKKKEARSRRRANSVPDPVPKSVQEVFPSPTPSPGPIPKFNRASLPCPPQTPKKVTSIPSPPQSSKRGTFASFTKSK